ncbi:MAG: hypothetical protein ACLP7O_04940 [Terracidiphilus sp.]
MFKFLVTSFFVLIVAAPALAKPTDVYPVSCNDLWVAVKDTLENPSNYTVISMDDLAQRSTFVVVGDLTQYTQKVALTATKDGCLAKAAISEIGPDNINWRQFHHRLAKSLAKLQAAKPKPAEKAAGQQQ